MRDLFKRLSLVPVCLAFIPGCSNEPGNIAGGGTDVDNGYIAGVVYMSSGSPGSSTEITLLPADYNPIIDTADSILQRDTADANGSFFFQVKRNVIYALQAYHPDNSQVLFLPDIHAAADTTETRDTLKEGGVIKIVMPDTVDTAGRYFYIRGTTLALPFTAAIPVGNNLLSIEFTSVPPMKDMEMYMTGKDMVGPMILVTDSLNVIPLDTVYIELDTLEWFFRGTLYSTAFTPEKNAPVYLMSINYDPGEDLFREIANAFTDDKGTFVFYEKPDTDFTLQALNIKNRSGVVFTPAFSEDHYTLIDTFEAPGNIAVVFPDTVDTENTYVYIPGTIHYADIANSLPTPKNTRTLFMSDITRLSNKPLYMQKRDSVMPPVILAESITVKSHDTVTVMVADTTSKWFIQGTVYDNLGRPFSNATVYVMEDIFDAMAETVADSFMTTTDRSGIYECMCKIDAPFTVQIIGTYDTSGILITEQTQKNQYIYFDTAHSYGTLLVIFEDTVDTEDAYVYIPGTQYAALMNECKQSANGTRTLTLKNITPLRNQSLVYKKRNSQERPIILSDSVSISQSDTTVLFLADTTKQWQRLEPADVQLTGAMITSIQEGPDGAVYIGTNNKGILVYTGSEWIFYNSLNSNIPDNYIRAFTVGLDNSIWVATQSGGIARFDKPVWTVYNTDNSMIPSNGVSDMFCKSDGNYWISTGSNVVIFDGNNQWTIIDTADIPANPYAMFEDKNGTVWMGWTNRQYILEYRNAFEILTYDNNNTGLPFDYILKIVQDSSGVIWYASFNSGLFLNDNGHWDQHATIAQIINGIVIDNTNMIWLSTNNGMARYENEIWFSFENKYLPKTEQYFAMFLDSKNNIWFGSAEGAIIIYGPTANTVHP